MRPVSWRAANWNSTFSKVNNLQSTCRCLSHHSSFQSSPPKNYLHHSKRSLSVRTDESFFRWNRQADWLIDVDTLKIEHYPHQAKVSLFLIREETMFESCIQTNDVVIRQEDDERLTIADDKRLVNYAIVDGTEISFFKGSDYESYKQSPILTMDWSFVNWILSTDVVLV